MKRKRLDRDLWGFQGFPYYQMELNLPRFRGQAGLVKLLDGDVNYWTLRKAGRRPVCGKGMLWLQLIPEGQKRVITVMLRPHRRALGQKVYPMSVSVWYVDVIEGWDLDEDGVIAFTDKYLDVVFTPQGDVNVDDRDELDTAYRAGELSDAQYEEAVAESVAILRQLCTDIEATELWCYEVLEAVQERIREGLKPMETRYQRELKEKKRGNPNGIEREGAEASE